MNLEQRCVAEWQRLNHDYQIAKREHMDDALCSILSAMNTITRILGYEPKEAAS